MKSEKTEPMTLTKATIIEKLQDELGSDGFTKSKSSEVIETLLTIMKDTMEKGEDILISGFGKFQVREKSQRKGRNPATGDTMMLSPRRVVTFKCSGRLRDRINGEE